MFRLTLFFFLRFSFILFRAPCSPRRNGIVSVSPLGSYIAVGLLLPSEGRDGLWPGSSNLWMLPLVVPSVVRLSGSG